MTFGKFLKSFLLHKAFREYERTLERRDQGSCLIALVMNTSRPAAIDDVVVTTAIIRNVQQLELKGCKKLWIHLTAFGGILNSVFTISNALSDSKIEEVKVISPLRLGATASLLTIVIADEIYVRSNTVVDPFRISAQKEEMEKIKSLIETKVLGKVRSEKMLWDVFFNSNFSITGKMLKEILNNVVLMDEIEKELDRASVSFENVVQRALAQLGSGGVILSEGESLILG